MKKTALEGGSWFVLLTRHSPVDRIKKDGMGETCGTHGKENNRYVMESDHCLYLEFVLILK